MRIAIDVFKLDLFLLKLTFDRYGSHFSLLEISKMVLYSQMIYILAANVND